MSELSLPNTKRLVNPMVGSRSPRDDFETEATAILATEYPNVLLLGSGCALSRALEIVLPFLRTPVAAWTPAAKLSLPEGSCGTLIVHGIDTSDTRQQEELLAWMAQRGVTQIVSTAGLDFVSMVDRGLFPEALYYRLNHLTFPVPDAEA